MSVAETAVEGSGQSEPHPPRRVVLLSESTGLAGLLKHLLGPSGRLHRFASLLEAVEESALEDADTVVLDLPSKRLGPVLAKLHHDYQGELIVLSNRGQQGSGVIYHPAWTLVTRPFSVHTLGTALGLPGHDRGEESTPTGESPPPAPSDQPTRPTSGIDGQIAARRPPFWGQLATGQAGHGAFDGRLSRPLAALAHGWRTRRPVRAAGFSVLALVAFSIAFALAAQGQCASDCHPLGTVLPPAPTAAPSDSRVPPTTGPKRVPQSTATSAGSQGTGAYLGVSGGGLARTSTPEPAVTTTTHLHGAGGGGTVSSTPTTAKSTPTTHPPTTPTTEPPTTPTTGLPSTSKTTVPPPVT